MLPLLLALLQNPQPPPIPPSDPFAPLAIYNGAWTIHAEHLWSGATPGAAPGTPDHLLSHCQRFTLYFACEQTVNGKPQALLVYTATSTPGKLNCRLINPDGLAGGRGDLTLDGNHFTYLDKPPPSLKGNWSRTENFILDPNHIRFEEYESSDEGKTWTKTNAGIEERTAG